jgi:hypothetical protein
LSILTGPRISNDTCSKSIILLREFPPYI